MDDQTLARWNATCSQISGGPFRQVGVFVDKETNSAFVVFISKPGIASDTKILSGIGGDTATSRQIGEQIVLIARQHGLLDAETEVSIREGRLV